MKQSHTLEGILTDLVNSNIGVCIFYLPQPVSTWRVVVQDIEELEKEEVSINVNGPGLIGAALVKLGCEHFSKSAFADKYKKQPNIEDVL